MFGIFKKKNAYEAPAQSVYSVLHSVMRSPYFYRELNVSDTLEGRFEILMLHVFLVMNAMIDSPEGKQFNQALFDVLFADMDQAMREAGKGDMAVPRLMRSMMTGFNGRIHVYSENLNDSQKFTEALLRNVYSGDASKDKQAKRLATYAQKTSDSLILPNNKAILHGEIKAWVANEGELNKPSKKSKNEVASGNKKINKPKKKK